MGLVLSLVDQYGKTSHVVLPAGKLSTDKNKCHEGLKLYFAGIYFKRGFASVQKEDPRTIELYMLRSGFLGRSKSKTILSLN